MINWNEFAKDVHQVAVANGLWDKPPSFVEIAVLCHMDLSKAAEEYHAGKPMVRYSCGEGNRWCVEDGDTPVECRERVTDTQHPEIHCLSKGKCPHGIAAHMADCVLRILDYLAEEEIVGLNIFDDPLVQVADRMDTIEVIAECHSFLAKGYIFCSLASRCCFHLLNCMSVILEWGVQNHVDMESILQAKHTYNKSRVRHDGVDKPQEVTP